MDLQIAAELPKRMDWRIGCAGSGFIMRDCHLVAYRKAGFNPVAIASRTEKSAREVAARHQISRVYTGYEELLNDPTIEVLDAAQWNALLAGSFGVPVILAAGDSAFVEQFSANVPGAQMVTTKTAVTPAGTRPR